MLWCLNYFLRNKLIYLIIYLMNFNWIVRYYCLGTLNWLSVLKSCFDCRVRLHRLKGNWFLQFFGLLFRVFSHTGHKLFLLLRLYRNYWSFRRLDRCLPSWIRGCRFYKRIWLIPRLREGYFCVSRAATFIYLYWNFWLAFLNNSHKFSILVLQKAFKWVIIVF